MLKSTIKVKAVSRLAGGKPRGCDVGIYENDGAVAKAAAFILLNRIKKTDVLKDAYKDAVLAALILMIEKSGDENKEIIIRMALSCI